MCNLSEGIREEALEEGREEGRAKGREEGREEEQKRGIMHMLEAFREIGTDRETAYVQLMKRYDLTREEAEEKLKIYGGW